MLFGQLSRRAAASDSCSRSSLGIASAASGTWSSRIQPLSDRGTARRVALRARRARAFSGWRGNDRRRSSRTLLTAGIVGGEACLAPTELRPGHLSPGGDGSALRAKHQCRRDQRGKADEQTEDKRLERAPALAPPERANLRAKIADRRECAVRKRALALDHPLSHVFGHGVDYLDDVSGFRQHFAPVACVLQEPVHAFVAS